jgi:hypothetical protein
MVTRVLLGKFPDGDNSPNGYGLRISQAGYEVTVANPDNERLVFNSDWPSILPLHINGSLSVSAGGTASVAHSLGYIPFASALINIGARGWESYQCANICYRLVNNPTRSYYPLNTNVTPARPSSNASTASETVAANPQQIYTYDGDRTTLARFYTDTSNAYFYCSEAAQLYYLVYRMKAF